MRLITFSGSVRGIWCHFKNKRNVLVQRETEHKLPGYDQFTPQNVPKLSINVPGHAINLKPKGIALVQHHSTGVS